MSVLRMNMARVRLTLGLAASVGSILGMWFSFLFQPVIYGVIVCLFALWIGLWPFSVPNLFSRVFMACLGSAGVCIVLVVIGEVIAYVQQDGQDELGPLLFVPAFMIGMGLPITVLAGIVAAIAPALRIRV